ncbi:ABC transporter membrane-spanning protein [Companilactobacillus sp. RD055328]|uniref:ABC transporter permease n=1 Tax=Companilactobacillus sp. RD055328 TaxID=2916634 RepID=UPI001FC7C966|nr:hypothetical protein [Companilactobacillus sp. RD055328]GKQ43179.1 ABC transporter membrane-spanning protein [Companilactobacillus sp. RD055328]
MLSIFKKTGYLTKTYLLKDWLLLIGTFLSIVFLVLGVATIFPTIYDSESSRIAMIETLKQPAMKAIIGVYHGDNSIGSFFSSVMLHWTAILGIIFAIIIAIKNTRNQEESNLSELLLSKSIGRLALPMASFLELFILFSAIFITNFIGLNLLNIDGLSTESAFLFSISTSLIALLFGTITIFFAQLANSSSGVNIMSYVLFLLSYIVVILGTQAKDNKLLWYSPLGWLSNLSLTDKNYYLPIILMIVSTIILISLSLFLQLHRDINSGLLPSSKGKDHASKLLAGFSSLNFKNQTTSMSIWIIVIFIAGLTYGSIFKDINKIVADNPYLTQIIAAQKNMMITNFSFMILGIFAIISLIPGLIHIYKIKNDETKGYLEIVHSKRVSRTKIFITYTGIGLLDTVLTFISGTLGLYIAQYQSLNNPISLNHFVNASSSFLSIIIFVISLGIILVTFVPKLTNLIWIVLYYGFFVIYFGKLFNMPNWAIDISLFGLINKNWTSPLETTYIITFVISTVILIILSLQKYKKRDLVY